VRLRIPKLRQGAFFPVILEPRRRIDQALHAVVMEAYVHGVSTRSVDDLVQALGIDSGKSEVSRICAQLDEAVTAFRTRTLGHIEFPYVYLDATYLHVREASLGQVVSKAVVVATGITATGGWGPRPGDRGQRGGNVLAGLPDRPEDPLAWPGSGWSSPTSTPASWRRCGAACRAPRTSEPGPLRS
jgi:Transposase, Mutator family